MLHSLVTYTLPMNALAFFINVNRLLQRVYGKKNIAS